ncbi:MAG: 2Fe-2S iron-sulfur cluster-binding protein [Caldisericia bacterium]|nr:2Fe-2S iron-sulfur cluster-binding protein [Caldisericia bacterium]
MEKIKIKINGNEIEVDQGKTILQVAKELNLHIPTLCYLEPLSPQGACRLCIVEDRGKLVASCNTPIAPNMDIKLDTPDVISSRKLLLQLLFTERNHYCMYCEVSGNCELQNMGYEFGLDHFEFPTYEKRFEVDNSHDYIIMDPNRCILCRRCVKACSELAGHFVLGEMNRGIETLIIADMNLPLGESSCTSCGLCTQVCPTGALIDKRSVYLGKDVQTDIIYSNCNECAVGCGTKIYKKKNSNFIVKIYGDMNSEINGGVLCKIGRYSALFEEKPRVISSKFKEEANFKKLDRERLIKLISEKINELIVYIDGTLFNEEIELIKNVFKDKVYSLYTNEPQIPSSITLKDLNNEKEFIVIGVDLNREYGVVGSFVKRKVLGGEGKLAVFDSDFNSLAQISHYTFNINQLKEGLEELKDFKSPVVIYKEIPKEAAEILKSKDNYKFLWLPPETNSIGLNKFGIKNEIKNSKVVIFFGENIDGLKNFNKDTYIIAFTPYETEELLKRADVIVGISNGFEREGTFYNIDGKVVKKEKVLNPKFETLDLKNFLNEFNRVSSIK